MSATVLRAATRGSPLARWQADHVARLIRAAHPDVRVEVVTVETEGDRRLDVPISSFGGKGVFAKEVQAAVLEGRADFAVHSAKDLPSVTVDGLVLAAVPARGEARDALVGRSLDELAPGATVATGSQRRRAQLAALRPDLRFVELRGNMATRLTKVPDDGAIVVAAVALERLDLADRIREVLTIDQVVPQVGQGALAIECRADDEATRAVLAAIEDPWTRTVVDAERAFLAELGGDCDLPAGAHAVAADEDTAAMGATMVLHGFLAPETPADGSGAAHAVPSPGEGAVRGSSVGDDPVALGTSLARDLRAAVAAP